MGADTKIEWCDHTFNPWIGCTKISNGAAPSACDFCYAEPLRNLLANLGPKDDGRVFLYRGRPIKTDVRRTFLTALKNAGIATHYTWHDLRHTAASWMRQRKVPLGSRLASAPPSTR